MKSGGLRKIQQQKGLRGADIFRPTRRRFLAAVALTVQGFTGSITHTGDFFSAAVARTSDAQHRHRRRADHRAGSRRANLTPGAPTAGASGRRRLARFGAEGHAALLDQGGSVQYPVPVVRKRFYYDALAVSSVAPARKTFDAELLPDLDDRFLRAGHFQVPSQSIQHTCTPALACPAMGNYQMAGGTNPLTHSHSHAIVSGSSAATGPHDLQVALMSTGESLWNP